MKKSLQNDLVYTITKSLEPLITKISNETDISIIDLYSIKKLGNCRYQITRGINKGKRCQSEANSNGFCGKHQKYAIMENATLNKKTIVSKKITKTQQEIIDMLKTATPEKITMLKKHEFGYIHEQSGIIFEECDNSFIAIGLNGGNKLLKLSYLETETCEKMGWRYSYDMIEL